MKKGWILIFVVIIMVAIPIGKAAIAVNLKAGVESLQSAVEIWGYEIASTLPEQPKAEMPRNAQWRVENNNFGKDKNGNLLIKAVYPISGPVQWAIILVCTQPNVPAPKNGDVLTEKNGVWQYADTQKFSYYKLLERIVKLSYSVKIGCAPCMSRIDIYQSSDGMNWNLYFSENIPTGATNHSGTINVQAYYDYKLVLIDCNGNNIGEQILDVNNDTPFEVMGTGTCIVQLPCTMDNPNPKPGECGYVPPARKKCNEMCLWSLLNDKENHFTLMDGTIGWKTTLYQNREDFLTEFAPVECNSPHATINDGYNSIQTWLERDSFRHDYPDNQQTIKVTCNDFDKNNQYKPHYFHFRICYPDGSCCEGIIEVTDPIAVLAFQLMQADPSLTWDDAYEDAGEQLSAPAIK